jgi:hypothetical protein
MRRSRWSVAQMLDENFWPEASSLSSHRSRCGYDSEEPMGEKPDMSDDQQLTKFLAFNVAQAMGLAYQRDP